MLLVGHQECKNLDSLSVPKCLFRETFWQPSTKPNPWWASKNRLVIKSWERCFGVQEKFFWCGWNHYFVYGSQLFGKMLVFVCLQGNGSQDQNGKDDDHAFTTVLCSARDHFTLKQDMCLTCGSYGVGEEGKLIACVQCGQCYHPCCVNIKVHVLLHCCSFHFAS